MVAMPVQQENELKQQLSSTLAQQVIGVRDRRRVVEQTWLRSRRTWMNSALEQRFTSADTASGPYNIPAGRRAAERSIVRGVKLLTPNVKWFEVAPMSDVSSDKLSNVDKFMWYVLRKRIKSRTNISQLVRSMMLYGLCHMKTSISVVNGQVWPSQRVVDDFAFYIYPETVSDITEAELVFEDFLFTYDKYRTYVAKGIVEDISQSDLTKPDWPYHLVERLAYQGITDPTANVDQVVRDTQNKLEATATAFVSLTELWLHKDDALYQVYIAWNLKDGARIVGFFKSEYDKPLYRSVVHRSLPGELYTSALMEDINELDILQNDQLNKFQEAVDWEQGFVAFNDSGGGRKDTYKMKGRAKWEFGDDPRQALQLIQPPVTSTNQLRAWQIYLALINSMAGAGTIAEGQPGRNMPRAGFAMNALLEMGLADIQDIAEMIEQEVLTPSLGDIYKVSSKFIPDGQLMRIPGGVALYNNQQSTILKRQDIIGDYEFEWVGSLQSQDNAMRAQRSLIFFNLLAQPMIIQLMQSQGYSPNIVELVKFIWRDSLGERGLSEIVVPLQKLQQQIQAEQQGNSVNGNGNSNGVPGLNYNLPSVTSGFVQQR